MDQEVLSLVCRRAADDTATLCAALCTCKGVGGAAGVARTIDALAGSTLALQPVWKAISGTRAWMLKLFGAFTDDFGDDYTDVNSTPSEGAARLSAQKRWVERHSALVGHIMLELLMPLFFKDEAWRAALLQNCGARAARLLAHGAWGIPIPPPQ